MSKRMLGVAVMALAMLALVAGAIVGKSAILDGLSQVILVVAPDLIWPSAAEESVTRAQNRSTPDRITSVFDLRRTTIPTGAIRSGGPRKDGIPALNNPRMLPADKAFHVKPDERVVGVALGGEARAYPLLILNYHEIVDDNFGDVHVAIGW